MTRFLIVVAHPDDEVLGCGATSVRLMKSGHQVTSCILVSRAEARAGVPAPDALLEDAVHAQSILGAQPPIMGQFPNIQLNVVPHLELVRFIEAAILRTEADAVFTHHPADINDDHAQTSRACQAAARLFQRRSGVRPLKGLFFMEVLSSTDWSFAPNDRFAPNAFVEIGEDALASKLRALAAYRGVMREYPHPRSCEAVRALALLRGAQAGMNLAEAFETVYIDLGNLT